MSTMENKIKLNLRPSIGVAGDKIGNHHQPPLAPPTKLLINHGKPNFTINRSVVKSNQRLLSNNNNNNNNNSNGSINNKYNTLPLKTKFTLKKPQIPTTTNTQTLLRKAGNNDNDNKKDEFLEKRKQIYDKIEKENSIEANGYMNKIENGFTTIPISPREHHQQHHQQQQQQQNFVKKISERIENGIVLKSPSSPPPTSPKPQQFQKSLNHISMQNGISSSQTVPILNGNNNNSNNDNNNPEISTIPVNTSEKPILPKKTFTAASSQSSSHLPPPPPPPLPFTLHKSSANNSAIKITNGNENGSTLNTIVSPKTPISTNSNGIGNGYGNGTNNSGIANFEQKTFVSFSKDLSSGPNKYPDIIKVIKHTNTNTNTINGNKTDMNNGFGVTTSNREKEVLEELSKLKFDIDVKQEDVIIKPVIRNS